jgi:cation transport ATPase
MCFPFPAYAWMCIFRGTENELQPAPKMALFTFFEKNEFPQKQEDKEQKTNRKASCHTNTEAKREEKEEEEEKRKRRTKRKQKKKKMKKKVKMKNRFGRGLFMPTPIVSVNMWGSATSVRIDDNRLYCAGQDLRVYQMESSYLPTPPPLLPPTYPNPFERSISVL